MLLIVEALLLFIGITYEWYYTTLTAMTVLGTFRYVAGLAVGYGKLELPRVDDLLARMAVLTFFSIVVTAILVHNYASLADYPYLVCYYLMSLVAVPAGSSVAAINAMKQYDINNGGGE